MKTSEPKIQSGFALLIFLVILMGVGGLALTGFSQQALKEVEAKKIAHNKRILQQAKQALLMYAYNYPDIALSFNNTIRGPGRLPCPDTDNSGTPNPPCSGGSIGRLPWNANGFDFYEAEDSSGETLWYAVSDAFDNNLPLNQVNSDSVGTMTIFDQTGSILYDGSSNGVAAVIIAPGSPLARDENNDGVYEYQQVRSTAAERNNPRNYLDIFNSFDNSIFVNASSAAVNGFILGSIREPDVNSPAHNTIVVNDQVVIVTAAEVIKMAEKATLQAYKDAINDYLTNTAGVYPWLYDFQTDDLDEYYGTANLTSTHPVGALSRLGRIPSIFSSYFSENQSQQFDSEMRLIVSKTFTIEDSSPVFTDTVTLDATSALLDNAQFLDDGTPSDDIGRLVADGGTPVSTLTRFYTQRFDGSDDWIQCEAPADNLSDCNRNSSGDENWISTPNQYEARVIEFRIELDFTTNQDLTIDYDPAPALSYSAAGVGPQHAEIRAQFPGNQVSGVSATVFWEGFDYEVGGSKAGVVNDSQPFDNNNNMGSGDGALITLSTGDITIGLRYFPEFPSWAHSGENDWHNSVLMAIAADYQPGVNPTPDCLANPPCLEVTDIGGVTDDKVSLLVISGEPFDAGDDGLAGYADDLIEIFDGENADLDDIFRRRQGDDKVLIMQ